MAHCMPGSCCWLLTGWLGSPAHGLSSWIRVLKAWHLDSMMEHAWVCNSGSFVFPKIQVWKLPSVVLPYSVGQSKSQDCPDSRGGETDSTAYWKEWQRITVLFNAPQFLPGDVFILMSHWQEQNPLLAFIVHWWWGEFSIENFPYFWPPYVFNLVFPPPPLNFWCWWQFIL